MITAGIEDTSYYVCRGKTDWKIIILAVLYSIMTICASINLADEKNTVYIRKQILFLAFALIVALVCSRISYYVYVTNARMLSAGLFSVLMLRYILVIVGLIEQPISMNWIRLGSVNFYMPVLVLLLGCFVLATVGGAGQMEDILKVSRGNLWDVVMIVSGFFLCDGWKYLVIYLIMTALVFSVRFSKGRRFLACFAAVFIMLSILFFSLLINSGYSARSYYAERINAFLDPFSSIQIMEVANSLYMIKSGGIFGQGIGGSNGIWGNHRDSYYLVCKMIQDMGWFGLLCFVLLFALLCWRIVLTVAKAPDRIGFYMGIAILLIFLGRFLVNSMVNLNLLPFVGVELPLRGSGNQWIIIDYFLLGIVLNISKHKIERV